MGDEETRQSTRRRTRSLASSAIDNTTTISPRTTTTTAKRTTVSYKPTINDLIYGFHNNSKSLSLDDIISSFPGRTSQINQLLSHVGPLNSPMLPLFIYGGASTGKTSITLEIFRYLGRPFVYSSCITCYSPRILFESILNKLSFHKRVEENGYMSLKKCDKPSDFANSLRDALVNVLDILKKKKKMNSESSDCWGNMIYLIFDDFELVREWDKSSTILPFLFGLYRMLGLSEIGIIFISKVSPDAYYASSGHIEPVPLYFPGYTEKDLHQIFKQKQERPELYSHFLDIVLKPFSRVTRQVDELCIAFRPLYEKYCEPLNDPSSNFSWETKDAKRRLFSHLSPHIKPSLNEVLKVSSFDDEAKADKVKGRVSGKKLGAHDEELDFHMSGSAKYLLISAFLASRNPATLDASWFDSTGGVDNCKKRRKCSEKTKEQKETAEQELLLKGPGIFPLERLLAIFQCITSVADLYVEEEVQEEDDPPGNQVAQNDLTSNVLLQVSSLCNANFISKGSSCPLEGSTRYKSTVSEKLALKIARSLKFPLSRYLYRQ